MAVGTFLASFSYYLEPKLLDILIESEIAAKLKKISKILPICSFCKKFRDSEDNWQPIENYLLKYSKIFVSHSLCPECIEKYYPETLIDKNRKTEKNSNLD